MSPSPDIANLLRQKQMMDQFNQITSQGTGAAMLGGGANLNQFNDTGGGSQTTSTGLPAPPQKGGGIFSSMVPGLKQVEAAKSSMDSAIQNKMSDMFTPKDSTVHSMDYQAAQGPGGPTLMQGGAPYSGPQLQLGPDGQLTVAATKQPQFSPVPGRYTPTLGQ